MDTFNKILDWFRDNLQTTGQKVIGVIVVIALIGLIAAGIIQILGGKTKQGLIKFAWAIGVALLGALGLRIFSNVGKDASQDFKDGLGAISALSLVPTYIRYRRNRDVDK
ncbi:hypothetical protein [Staphylococcus pasteuri]|uniref:hypothetical protein n=1 Tax=Staphylococcus pasteuri TaxID=45972 RepID=UPI001C3FE7C8|nr:hypothetical protein [Staphylococcus pasteuri]